MGGVLRAAYILYAGVVRATPYLLEAVLLMVLTGLGVWSWRRDRRWIVFVVIFGLTAPLAELVVSLWRPIFLPRTLIWAAVPLYVTVAAGLLCLRRRVFAVALAVLVVLSAAGLRTYYFDHDKEAWDQAAAFVDHHLQRGDAVVFGIGFLQIPFDYYYAAPSTYSVPEIGLTGTSNDTFTVLQETSTRRRVWLIVSHPQPSTDAVIASLEGAGRLVAVAGFTDVDVYLFDNG